ncbi:glycoside hydrolase family 3 N-terminal domain-containing protein [Litorihabitans aurantiacus]|uniref:Beta-glucosidase n=1 Tax=Litorihabitans aurantiacus TaxID=1930061 RepID=A0AA37XGW6_9MICO|nr:glycoside hydrolase family 3 N-terminal domain-containing protein [Litorihabitans aurantiacus]GMA33256.1 beta-glucosidase [Litorihabitans aurantiacus]
MNQVTPSGPWQDTSLSTAARVEALVAAMTLEEKVSQLVGLWVGADASGGDVAPHQGDMTQHGPELADVIVDGLGQLTRPFGTAPVEPELGARSLARSQRAVMAANRFGIPAQVHEECLAGFAAWRATAYPVPLSWGATFHPELVQEMAGAIGASMRSVGVHQGLAPVLDVVRDYRWGRVEETVGEDPYLVGTIGAGYVRGLEGAGVVATLKHFAGYSGSRAGRNHAPVSAGPREMQEVFYPPFEAALREGGARSVMNSYAEVDGVPAAADEQLLTTLLRQEWGFAGTVVADYFAVAFLRTLHRVAATDGEAAALALTAGIDVELPSVHAYGEPLLAALRDGLVGTETVDRALRRVLTQKIELGLLDPGWTPEVDGAIDLDPPAHRALALELAREAVVLLANDGGALPLRPGARLAVVGPLADDPYAMLGCYSFPAHVGVHHPHQEVGIEIPTVLAELRRQHDGEVTHAPGCDVKAPGREGFADAVARASEADVAVVVVGDQAGLFGRGTSGEGCDAADLRLPGEQHALVEAVLGTGTPVVVLALAGRPYAFGAFADRAAAIVQTFFPGQAGGTAIAEVLTGAVNPSGHLPVGVPRDPGSQPSTYLAPPYGLRTEVSNLDPTPLYPFGHGRSYAEATWGEVTASADTWAVDGEVEVSVQVANATGREVADVVQLYLHDPVAEVPRPDVRLVGYQRVMLAAGEEAAVTFRVHADLASYVGRAGDRIVDPGAVELRVSRSSADVHATLPLEMVGRRRRTGAARRLTTVSSAVVLAAGADPTLEVVPA